MPVSAGSARVCLDDTASERLRRERARQRMRALDALCRDGRATHLDFRVLYHVTGQINRVTGEAWQQQATMAMTLSISRRGVQQSLERLIALGYLAVEVQRGRSCVNRYRLSRGDLSDEAPVGADAARAQAGADEAHGQVAEGDDKCAVTFAASVDKMRNRPHENTNVETAKCAAPFAQDSFHNPFTTPEQDKTNLGTGDDSGVWVNSESMQADAWRRHWRAIGQSEPIRSGRTGMYARKLPSAWPPGVGE